LDRLSLRRVLVPNRGEIAARIARTCREMGVECVLARAEDDVVAPVARLFDLVISLGSGSVAETYLDVSRIIDAARRSGADAIHPGYGFLSERAELAAAAEDAGLTFIGPGPEVMRQMGSKVEARTRMASLGIPVVPGYDGEDQDIDALETEAARIGYPLLVKASAGGGGKGMKLVEQPSQFRSAVESARGEAERSFGNGTLLLERFVLQPRHVEIQIFGDRHGNLVHLFERDCSIQRRHQKVIEESPAPAFTPELRARMTQTALEAASGIGYQNAGTVEFIVSGEEFYFLEINTRLQVEHPVTELVVGTDLVRAQIEVAAGNPLPWRQESLSQRGHAIECRIYAEDPDNGYLPQTGLIGRYREPEGPGVRVDSGVAEGTEITVRYDPLLAKLICWADTRDHCIERTSRALEEFLVLGTRTNIGHLRRIVRHPGFREGSHDTTFIEARGEELDRESDDDLWVVASVLDERVRKSQQAMSHEQQRQETVWESMGAWGR
jgi:3-methylcrotonyl-CoA carboxylase alpha subunit